MPEPHETPGSGEWGVGSRGGRGVPNPTPHSPLPTPSLIPLRAQLACARRELALRTRVYPRLVAQETMRPEAAERELAAMRAITLTLQRLVEAEAGGGEQAEVCGGQGGDGG